MKSPAELKSYKTALYECHLGNGQANRCAPA